MPQQGQSPAPQETCPSSPDMPVCGFHQAWPTHRAIAQPCPVSVALPGHPGAVSDPVFPHQSWSWPCLWSDGPPGLGPTPSWSLRMPQFFYLSTFSFSTSYCEVSLTRSLKFPCLSHLCHHLWVSPAFYQVFTEILIHSWLFSRKSFTNFLGHGQALANAYYILSLFSSYLYRLHWAIHILLSCSPYIAIALDNL